MVYENVFNGWDLGPNAILNNLSTEELQSPVKVVITEMFIDTSRTYEMLEKYLDEVYVEPTLIQSASTVVEMFKTWYHRNYSHHPDYSLYVAAKFDILGDVKFKPTWGLNIKSFLPIDSKQGKITEDLWSQEIQKNAHMKISYAMEKEYEETLSLYKLKI